MMQQGLFAQSQFTRDSGDAGAVKAFLRELSLSDFEEVLTCFCSQFITQTYLKVNLYLNESVNSILPMFRHITLFSLDKVNASS